MTSKSSVSARQALAALPGAFKMKDSKQVAALLGNLCAAEPNDWLTLLVVNNIVPHPRKSNIKGFLDTWRDSLAEHDAKDPKCIVDFLRFYWSLEYINRAYRLATGILEESGIWERPPGEAIFRAACFLEDQVHTANEQIKTRHSIDGTLIFTSLIADSYPTQYGESNSSFASSFEENGENLQLVMSYVLDKYGGIQPFDGKQAQSPYGDDELWKLIGLATFWRNYDTIWERTTYFGWHPVPVKADDGATSLYCAPPR